MSFILLHYITTTCNVLIILPKSPTDKLKLFTFINSYNSVVFTAIELKVCVVVADGLTDLYLKPLHANLQVTCFLSTNRNLKKIIIQRINVTTIQRSQPASTCRTVLTLHPRHQLTAPSVGWFFSCKVWLQVNFNKQLRAQPSSSELFSGGPSDE